MKRLRSVIANLTLVLVSLFLLFFFVHAFTTRLCLRVHERSSFQELFEVAESFFILESVSFSYWLLVELNNLVFQVFVMSYFELVSSFKKLDDV